MGIFFCPLRTLCSPRDTLATKSGKSTEIRYSGCSDELNQKMIRDSEYLKYDNLEFIHIFLLLIIDKNLALNSTCHQIEIKRNILFKHSHNKSSMHLFLFFFLIHIIIILLPLIVCQESNKNVDFILFQRQLHFLFLIACACLRMTYI